jgi:hypothetical protein
MRVDAASPPGRSQHGWGGAVDFDVAALEFAGTGRGTDEALARFWELAAADGWTPIIANPWIAQSESWHFDRFGWPMLALRKLFADHGYRSNYGLVAEVGCTLAGTMPHTVGHQKERYVQARLLIDGHWCGPVDGIIGKNTRAALADAGVTAPPGATVDQLITALNEAGVGSEALGAL